MLKHVTHQSGGGHTERWDGVRCVQAQCTVHSHFLTRR